MRSEFRRGVVALAVAVAVALGAAACGGGAHNARAHAEQSTQSQSTMAQAITSLPVADQAVMSRTMRLMRSLKFKHCPTQAQILRLTVELNRVIGSLGRSEPFVLGCLPSARKAG